MRMFFKPAEEEAFTVVRDQLAACAAEWCRARGDGAECGAAADPYAMESALDYRHRGTVDGRLGLWQARHVEEFLLSWLPRTLTQPPGQEPMDGPGALRCLLRYLDAAGLADPRGDALSVLERAVDEAAAGFGAAMADRTHWGMAKFWATTAAEQGVDLLDERAMTRFTERAQRGEVPYDEAALDVIMERYQRTGPPQVARAEPQLPVTLPGEDPLREAAAVVPVVRQLGGLAAWAGTDGRELTKLGRLKIADAKQLVRDLETGDRPGSPRTSAELPRLNLVFEWAKKARLVRLSKGRLYAVAKARPLLDDPLALWQRAFETVFELRDPLLGEGPDGYRPVSMLYGVYEDALPDVLNTLYSLPHPMPWPRLRDSVHLTYRARYDFTRHPVTDQDMWLRAADADLREVLGALERLGAINRSEGMAHPVFLDLPDVPSQPGPQLPAGMPPELAALLFGMPESGPDPAAEARGKQLKAELAERPVQLIRLTDLGTRAVRHRLLDAGRDAPLIGELTDAPAAGLLGVLAEHYDPAAARTELAAWSAAHGGWATARELLVQAVRDMPFRTRAEAMLDVVAAALPEPEGEGLLRSLRGDARLAPTVLSVLTRREILSPEDLTDTEARLMVAESLLQLLESAEEGTVVETLLSQGRTHAREALEAALASGHPDHAGLARLRAFADGPLWQQSAQLGRLNAARARLGTKPAKRKRRR